MKETKDLFDEALELETDEEIKRAELYWSVFMRRLMPVNARGVTAAVALARLELFEQASKEGAQDSLGIEIDPVDLRKRAIVKFRELLHESVSAREEV